jgi:hypothetical protein
MIKELGLMLKDLDWVNTFRKRLIHHLAGEAISSNW